MTHSSLLRSDETLFRDPEVFEFTYLPEQIHYRDAQVRELAFLLRPAVRGGSAGCAVLRGPPGTGKTTTVRRIFREVREETQRIVPAYLNCRHDRTALAVFGCIFEQVFGYAPASRHLDGIKRGIAARLRDEDAALVVCLDDANELIPAGTYNTLLYQILRLYEKWDVKMPGVFAVASDLGLNPYAEANESVRSVFHPTEVNFPPYRMVEVRGILASGRPSTRGWSRSSSSTALRESPPAGSHPGGGGWAQKGCTRRRDGSSAGGQVAGAPGLPEGERALLSRIAEMSVAGADMIGGTVFEEVKEYLPVGKTTYHEHLKRLARAGPGAGGPRLRYDPEEVLAVCTGQEESRIDRQPGPARNS